MLAAAKARQSQWANPATLTLALQAARMLGKPRHRSRGGRCGAGRLADQPNDGRGRRTEEKTPPSPPSDPRLFPLIPA